VFIKLQKQEAFLPGPVALTTHDLGRVPAVAGDVSFVVGGAEGRL